MTYFNFKNNFVETHEFKSKEERDIFINCYYKNIFKEYNEPKKYFKTWKSFRTYMGKNTRFSIKEDLKKYKLETSFSGSILISELF